MNLPPKPSDTTDSPLLALPTVLCILDVETTGASAQKGRVTEVGIVRVEDWAGPKPIVSTWSSLVNPEQNIPSEIQSLTGITMSMVKDAPRFGEVADQVMAMSREAIFVAHQARFDYGFIKAEMERCDKSFHAKTLCTVRLSQGMFPERAPHSLDAIIARHRLTCEQRHRALGDAQVLWEFLKVLKAQESHTEMAMLIKKIMRHPSLPAHLPSDQLERIPKTPGVYRFYGLNQHPLYIGKSICLRDRVSDHFCVDHRSERGMRLASEIRRIEWEQAAGDFGARLREIHLIKTEMPAHNVALRKKTQPWWIQVDPASSRLRYVPCSSTLDAQQTYFGPFPSKASVKHHITELARLNKLCLKVIGFEKSEARSSKTALPAPPLRPCFNFQIQKCLGACCGQETVACSAQRLIEALEPKRRPTWRWAELIVEEPSCIYDAPHLHRFRDWQWLGSRAEQFAGEWTMDEGAGFDLNIYHLLLPVLKDHPPDAARKVLGATRD